MPEEKAYACVNKAKSSVPAPTEELKYDYDLMIDLIESVAYGAKSVDMSNLGLPGVVTKLVAKHFAELGEITKELKQAIEDKKILEQ